MPHNRYAVLTVDTEALSNRAADDHVRRLMLGEFPNGTAGVREIAAIGNEVGAKHVFFMDLCGAYDRREEIYDVIRWLDADGQDVQLHAHPEYLPKSFWPPTGFTYKPEYMNAYRDEAKTRFVLEHFGKEIAGVTGKPVRAFRAGSFRWNTNTLRAMQELGIRLAFNNSTQAIYNKQSKFSLRTNRPFRWSNGVIEIPVTEKNILPRVGKALWARFQFPLSVYVRYRPWWASFVPYSVSPHDGFLVCLVHCWSLLYRDEKGYAEYRDDKRIEGYRKLVRQLSRDYDIVTTGELLELCESGKIDLSHVEDIKNVELAETAGGKA